MKTPDWGAVRESTATKGRWVRALRATAAAMLVTACGSPDDPAREFDHSHLDVIELETALLSRDPVIGAPFQVVATNGHLWVADAAADPGLHLLNSDSGELIASMGRRGGGPNEFSSYPNLLQRDPAHPEAVWAYDGGNQRLMRFQGPQDSVRNAFQLELFRLVRGTWLSPNRILAVTGNEENRLVLYDSLGTQLANMEREFAGPPEAPLSERMMPWISGFDTCVHPDGEGFAFVYGAFGRIEIFTNFGEVPIVADVPFPSEPVYELDVDGVPRYQRGPDHYLSCTATSDRIHALFSGSVPSAPAEQSNTGEWVHSFDWSGQLRAIYHLDRRISDFSFSPQGGRRAFSVSLIDATVSTFALPGDEFEREAGGRQ